MSLGSWRTFEQIDRDEGLAVMEAARESGITFLDDARYDDETKTAPIASGYSEVVFGELFARSVYERAEAIVSNKLWWEFWPNESAAEEVDGSLARMGFDYLDIIYSSTLPDDLALEEVVDSIRLLAECEGIFGETAGGVTLGVLRKLLAGGQLDPEAETVIINSGDGLKTLDAVASAVRIPAPIKPTLEAFQEAVP